MTGQSINERLGVAGSGAIACGLAAVAARTGEVVLCARSDASAEKARGRIAKLVERCGWEIAAEVEVTTDLARLGEHSSYLVEAIVEELEEKVALIGRIKPHLREDAILAAAGLSRDSFAAVRKLAEGTRRDATIHVRDARVSAGEGPSTLEVAFALPGGAYATAVMREVMKTVADRVDDTPEGT